MVFGGVLLALYITNIVHFPQKLMFGCLSNYMYL